MSTNRVGLRDLHLLVDVALGDGNPVYVGAGNRGAMRRLVRAGLLEQAPESDRRKFALLTSAGQVMRDRLLAVLHGGPVTHLSTDDLPAWGCPGCRCPKPGRPAATCPHHNLSRIFGKMGAPRG